MMKVIRYKVKVTNKKESGINIRSGLELEIPVSEIFNVNIAPEGNIIAKIYS